MDIKHTPLPWTADESVPSDGFECYWLQGSNGRLIGSINGPQSGSPKADAAFIVQACNSFESTLFALKTAAEDCRMALSGEWDKGDEGFEATLSILEDAISKADGK